MRFVLDNSVAMRWLFGNGSENDLAYAARALEVLQRPEGQAVAPSIWPLEVANVIMRAENKGLLREARSSQFIRLLDALAVEIDVDTAEHALESILELSRRFALSAYDAAYLELALRHGLVLATLDSALQDAATQAGVTGL